MSRYVFLWADCPQFSAWRTPSTVVLKERSLTRLLSGEKTSTIQTPPYFLPFNLKATVLPPLSAWLMNGPWAWICISCKVPQIIAAIKHACCSPGSPSSQFIKSLFWQDWVFGWSNWRREPHNLHIYMSGRGPGQDLLGPSGWDVALSHEDKRSILVWAGMDFWLAKEEKNVLHNRVHENVNIFVEKFCLNWTTEWVLMPVKLPAELRPLRSCSPLIDFQNSSW